MYLPYQDPAVRDIYYNVRTIAMERILFEVEDFVLISYNDQYVILDKKRDQILLRTSVKKIAIEKFKNLIDTH
jgi:hypothetical protein